MSKIRQALIFSVLSQYSVQILSLVTIVVLARLLTPEEIGVFAVAASVAFLATEMRALGAGQYLVRETEICDEKIRSATGLMMVVSWGLAVLIAASAPFLADFYDEPDLVVIFWIIAATFIFAPFTSVPSALLSREMQFDHLFVVNVLSTIIRSASTIAFVLLGFSYYGLAMGILAGTIAEVVLFTYYRPAGTPWLPSFSRFKELLRFGMFASTANTLQQFSLSIPDLVLGRVASMAEVGLFSRGLGVIVFLNNILVKAVSPVILPHFSEVKRQGGAVGSAYIRAIKLQAAICWPVFAVVNLAAYSMIRALFGDQWDVAVPVASVLAIWAILQSTHSFSSAALVAVGREKLMLKKEVIIFIARFSAVLYAASHSILMVAWALVIAGIIEFIVNTWVVKRVFDVSVTHMMKELLPSAIVAAACWGGLKVLGLFIDFNAMNSWISLLIVAVSMSLVWLAALRITNHEVWELIAQTVGPRLRRA